MALSSSDASGAMPLGNGGPGIGLWVEPWATCCSTSPGPIRGSETGRLLKLGKVRVSLSPNRCSGLRFHSTAQPPAGNDRNHRRTGKERTKLTVFADPGAPVLHLLCTSSRPVNVTAASEPWRTAPYDIPKEDSLLGINSAWPRTGTYDYTQAVESADQTLSDPMPWCGTTQRASTYPPTLDLMELHSLASRFDDPLLHRTFRVRMSGAGFVKRSPLEIATVRPVKHFDLRLATCTAQTPDIATWEQQLRATEAGAANGRKAPGSQPAMVEKFLGQKLHLRRNAGHRHGIPHHTILSAAKLDVGLRRRGAYPIKFNGGIFTVDPVFTDTKIRANADPPRNWGGDYWWQNTRLMYYPMLASGDFEMMLPLFRFYQDRLASFRTITNEYMDAEGAVIPETSSIFGLYRPGDYGWDRTGRQKGASGTCMSTMPGTAVWIGIDDARLLRLYGRYGIRPDDWFR
ncbi:MAG: DUF5703 domain-containing protein [Alistipes indistinctus]